MKEIICPVCSEVLITVKGRMLVDLPGVGSLIDVEIKCDCGQTAIMNIVNKLQEEG